VGRERQVRVWAAAKRSVKQRLLRALEEQAWSEATRIDLALQRRCLATTADYVLSHMAKARVLTSRFEVLECGLSQARGSRGLFCEFGVFRGESINHIARIVAPTRVFGFDSFEGLPAQWRAGFADGRFSLEGRVPDTLENVELLKGLFQETLPGFLAGHQEAIAFAHVDCDLYASTKSVFDLAGSRMGPGTVIVFDEYFNYPGWEEHEFKAFREFVATTRTEYDYLAYNARDQQVAVRLR